MSPEDVVYYAASGAFLIGGVVCFGIVWFRDWRKLRAVRRRVRQRVLAAPR